MNGISEFLLTCLYTVFVQNFIFTRGFGMSEGMRVHTRKGAFLRFALIISAFSLATCAACYAFDDLIVSLGLTFAGRAGVYASILFVIYIFTSFAFKFIFKAKKEKLEILGIAAINTFVLALPFINNIAALNLAKTLGCGLGAGFSYIFACLIISAGNERLSRNETIPALFKGTPALFIYVGIIALAFEGF